MNKIIEEIDVICQIKYSGEVIPLRLHFQDEDKEYHNYTIKSYKPLSHDGSYNTPDGLFVVGNVMKIFECKIEVFGVEKIIRLYYDTSKTKLKMAF